MSTNTIGGTQLLTSEGPVGTSGASIRVYSIVFLNAAATGVLHLRNGTTDTSPSHAQLSGSAATTSTVFTFGAVGKFFPNGCFVDFVANVISATVNYVQ